MSGLPSWANTEPSTYSTMEWMMLCGWMITSSCSGGMSKRNWASISSSPLFMSVAESTEILRPIDHLGCLQACSGVAAAILSGVQVRNGPPEAVRIRRRTARRASTPVARSGRHWKMALCSLSTGSSVTPDWRQTAPKSAPAMTMDSLLASSTERAPRAAASVGARPAAPTMAAMTASIPGVPATSTSSSGPTARRAVTPAARSRASNPAAAWASDTVSTSGRCRTASVSSLSTLR